jgi:cytidylate kinase
MAILIEGPDNSGKSTLCEKLSMRLGWPIVRAVRPLKDEDDMFEMCTNDIKLMQTNIIMDRSYIISDSIYGPLCRNQNLVDLKYWLAQMQTLQQTCHNLEFVFCDGLDSVLTNMSTHVIKITDTAAHLAAVEKNKVAIMNNYRALNNAMKLFIDTTTINPRDNLQVQSYYGYLEQVIVE